MNFHKDESHYIDARIIPNTTYEGDLALFYDHDQRGMSVLNFLRRYKDHNPELVHYLQLHYPEYLL